MNSGAVLVTGLGAVSAYGWGAEALWQGLSTGETGIAEPRRFDTSGQRTHVAGEAPAPPADLVRAIPAWRRLSQADRFAVAAAREAFAQAGLEIVDEQLAQEPGDAIRQVESTRVGVFFGGSTAAMAEAEDYFARLLRLNPPLEGRVPLRLLASHPLNGPGDAVARHLRVRGPVESLSSACASGALAIGAAFEALRSGAVDVAIAGGADSLCRLTYAGFNSLRAVDERPCRPFRGDRRGLSLGEGAGVVVLERADRATRVAARGARPLARLLGAGASCDAHHMTAPHPRGLGAAQAMTAALDDAGLGPQEIAFLNAHGTGTPLNDVSEASAVAEVFGESARTLPVTSTKAAVGHLLGASGALEAVATVLCLLAGQVHATAGGGEVDETLGLDVVLGASRPLTGETAVSTSFAFGGANAALVLSRWREAGP